MTTHRKHPLAFTIVELLVVIGIIVLLIGMLIPVVNKVRVSAYNAKSQQTVSRLSMAIDNYYTLFKAYPGPLSNLQLSRSTTTAEQAQLSPGGNPKALVNKSGNPGTLSGALDKITGSENLLLGLCGGVYYDRGSSANNGNFVFDIDRVGKGAKNLSTLEGKQDFGKQSEVFFDLKPGDIFINPSDKTGSYIDSGGAANDTIIPEILDGFPNGMPILYLRANVGAPGVAYERNSASATLTTQQYELRQILGYTGSTIGVGRPNSLRSKYTTQADFSTKPHGLQTVNPKASIDNPGPSGTTYKYPYDLHPYLRDPAASFDPAVSGENTTGSPKRKDSYILISPGPDRTYGTEDDITNFGSVK